MKRKRASLGKTTRPSLSGILPRERLFALLDEARDRPVVWISGPPGCGKTTLVASYLDRAGIASLWYQLDDGDSDVATFFYYLGLAAEELDQEQTEPLPLLTPERQPGLAVFTRRFFQSLYSRLIPPFAVVFDGCQEIPTSSPFHDVVREALAELPRGGRTLLLSRGDPAPALARMRANRALVSLGWDDLRLTREETGSIVRERWPEFPGEAIDVLYGKTQGWAAGLVLLLEQAKMIGSIADSPDLSTSQLVFDYLAGEIFQKTDPRTQDFLLRTACLPQMTTRNAQQLTGDSDAAVILVELHRNNYFVTLRQVRPEPVYQYHPMFREFLLSRGQGALPKAYRRQQQKTAARLLEAEGRIEDAVALFRESHDWEEMARLIEQHAATLLAHGRGETLARWIEDLPPEIRDRHPWVVYWAACSRAQLAPREGRLRYERAFALFRAQNPPEPTGMVLAASGAMDAILYELDDFSLLDRWIAVLDEAEQGGIALPSPTLEARVACSMLFSLTLRQPHRRDLPQWMERALASAKTAADPNLRMFVGLLSSLTLMWTGMFGRAFELIEATRRVCGEPGVSPFSLLTLKNLEAMHGMLIADRQRCSAAMHEGLKLAESTGVHTWTFQILVNGYGGALGAQDLDEAARIAGRLEALAAGAGRFNLCLYHHFQAWEAMLRKDLMLALQKERMALRMAIEVGCPFFEALCRLALAEVLAECKDEHKCIAHLQQLRPIVEAIDNRHLEFTCLLGFGRLALEHGRQRPGLNALRRAFALGREYGYAHALWWRPAAVARACAHALDAGIETDYVRSLVKRRNLVPEHPPLTVTDWPWEFRVKTLGGFRLEIYGAPLRSEGKAQRRPLELLKVLIACGGERVSEERVTEALWPRIDGDSAHRSFNSTLHRLRKLLGEERALSLHEGKLSLDRRCFWVDVWAFEQLVAEIDAALGGLRAEAGAARVGKLAQQLLDLYTGPFLAGEADAAWHMQPRERIRNRFARAMSGIGRFWEDLGQWDSALACYDRCLEAEPLAEGFYRQLMVCFYKLGRRAEVIEAFHRCRRALSALRVEPSRETRELYEKLA